MKIALLGGSYNPPHSGHVALLESLVNTGNFDEVWVLPCLGHPFGKKLENFSDRYEMCKLAFQEISPNIKILKTEQEINNLQGYSIVSLKHLSKNYPENSFFWVMGSDLLLEKNKWKDFDQIEKLVTLYPVPRAGYESSPYPEISSNEIRKKLLNHQSIKNLVPAKVSQYIEEKGLYR